MILYRDIVRGKRTGHSERWTVRLLLLFNFVHHFWMKFRFLIHSRIKQCSFYEYESSLPITSGQLTRLGINFAKGRNCVKRCFGTRQILKDFAWQYWLIINWICAWRQGFVCAFFSSSFFPNLNLFLSYRWVYWVNKKLCFDKGKQTLSRQIINLSLCNLNICWVSHLKLLRLRLGLRLRQTRHSAI